MLKSPPFGGLFAYRQIQLIIKQADILILFLLLENQFDASVKRANWNYYEPRTLHDSSLSLSTHCILASDMGDRELAYELFQRAAAIDAGPNMGSSDAGIHAASIAGIWQSAVFGFGGLRMLEGKLRVDPSLPASWRSLTFYFYWQGQKLRADVSRDRLRLTNLTGERPVVLTVHGKEYTVETELEAAL